MGALFCALEDVGLALPLEYGIHMSADVELTCIDCGKIFIFSVSDQDYFREKGYTSPVRCRPCRKIRKEARLAQAGEDGMAVETTQPRTDVEEKPSYPTYCTRCGHPTTVPFEPKPGRPIYCRECYKWAKNAEGAEGRKPAAGQPGARAMYPAVCATCGKPTEVPFEPRAGKPVYCRDCFRANRNGNAHQPVAQE